MGRFDRVLLTVDFDRTLTAPDSSIPERNLQAIRPRCGDFLEAAGDHPGQCAVSAV